MWGQYLGKTPVGDVCRVHKLVMELAWPDQQQPDLAAKFHERTTAGKQFQGEFLGASALMDQLLRAGHLPSFLPMSTITVQKEHSVECFYEMLIFTEADCLKVFGASSKALRLKLVPMELEDGSGTIKGVCVSPSGVPYKVASGLRRLRVSTSLRHQRIDELVNPKCTVRQEQADVVHKLSLERMNEQRQTAERSTGEAATSWVQV